MPNPIPTNTVFVTSTITPTIPISTPTPTYSCHPPALLYPGFIDCKSQFLYYGVAGWVPNSGELLSDQMGEYVYTSTNIPVGGHFIGKAIGDGTFEIIESTGIYAGFLVGSRYSIYGNTGFQGVNLYTNCWNYAQSISNPDNIIVNNSTIYVYSSRSVVIKLWNHDPRTFQNNIRFTPTPTPTPTVTPTTTLSLLSGFPGYENPGNLYKYFVLCDWDSCLFAGNPIVDSIICDGISYTSLPWPSTSGVVDGHTVWLAGSDGTAVCVDAVGNYLTADWLGQVENILDLYNLAYGTTVLNDKILVGGGCNDGSFPDSPVYSCILCNEFINQINVTGGVVTSTFTLTPSPTPTPTPTE